MRWILAAVFGAVGGFIAFLVAGDPSIGGQLGREIAAMSAVLGAVIAAPIGFFLGSLPFLSPTPPPDEPPPKRFSAQVAGGVCSKCGERILMASDGSACKRCDTAYHHECAVDGGCPRCTDRSDDVAD